MADARKAVEQPGTTMYFTEPLSFCDRRLAFFDQGGVLNSVSVLKPRVDL